MFADRIRTAEAALRETSAALSLRGSALPGELLNFFQAIANRHTLFPGWLEAHRVREHGMALLQRLDGSNQKLDYQGFAMDFADARMLLTQGYLAATWSLADRMSGLLTQLYALDEVTKNPIEQTRLMANFFSRKRATTGDGKRDGAKVGGLTAFVLKRSYGWPMSVSYVARNLFLHEGGISQGQPFFAGNRSQDGFRVRDDAIKELEARAASFGDGDCPTAWLWNQDDFRLLLTDCHESLDRAISQLILAGCENLKTHLRLLLE